MKANNFAAITAVAILMSASALAAQSSASFRVDADTIANGIGDITSLSYSIESTVAGGVATGGTSSANYRLSSGYQATLTGANTVSSTVGGYYQSILGRTADSSGLAFWSGEAGRVGGLGANVREVFFALSITFFASPEYTSRNASDAQFVTNLYRTFFVREPDSGGLVFWQGYLSKGMDRGALLTNFLFSPEFNAFMTYLFGLTSVRPEVDMTIDFFRGILGRLPDSGGFNYWLGQIRTAQCQGAAAVTAKVSELARLFVSSGEYASRENARLASDRTRMHVGDLYNAFLRRGAEPGGYNYWVSLIASGSQSRDDVLAAFLSSPEFQGRVTAVINAGCLP